MARISKLENAEFAKAVAEAYITGASRDEMAEAFGCHKDTISDWIRDPRVQAHAGRFARERVLRIIRKTDMRLLNIMEDMDDLDAETTIKIRKELISRPLIELDDGKGAGNDAQTMGQALDALEADPDMAAALKKWNAGAKGTA